MFGLYNKRETPKLAPQVGSTSDGEVNIVRVVRIVYSLIEIGVSVIVSKSLGFGGPAQLVGVVVLSLTIMEVNVDVSAEGGILGSAGVEGENCSENGEGFAELVVQFNGKSRFGITGDGSNSEVLVDVSGEMRITLNQTKGSVLGLGRIPVGLSESL